MCYYKVVIVRLFVEAIKMYINPNNFGTSLKIALS